MRSLGAVLALAIASTTIDTPRQGSPGAGPHARTAPSGAVVLRSTEELRAALAEGPTDLWLAPGNYSGPFVIRRALSLRGTSDVALDGGGDGTVLTIESNDVILENVAVRRSGRRHTSEDAGIKAKGERVRISDVRVEETLFGVSFEMCHACVLERASIAGLRGDEELRGDAVKLWEAHGSVVRDTHVDAGRDVVVWYTRRATLDNVVVQRGRYGTHLMYAHDCTVRASRFEHDVVGVFVMYSSGIRIEDTVVAGARGAAGIGFGFKDSDAVEVRRSASVANTTGTFVDNTPRVRSAPLVLEDDLFALNQVALSVHTDGAGIEVRRSDFRENAAVVTASSGNELVAEFDGNHFSDYQGYDLDGDRIGDVPYEVKLLSHDLAEAKPAIRLFDGTLAMGAIDAVARAVPVLAAKRVMTDPRPRMEALR